MKLIITEKNMKMYFCYEILSSAWLVVVFVCTSDYVWPAPPLFFSFVDLETVEALLLKMEDRTITAE